MKYGFKYKQRDSEIFESRLHGQNQNIRTIFINYVIVLNLWFTNKLIKI